MTAVGARLRFLGWLLAYGLLAITCLWSLHASNDLSFGRAPWSNLTRTLGDFARPSFLDVWFGNPRLEYKSDDGTVLRVENRREVEQRFLAGLVEATWTTIKIGTLGSLLAALLALPLSLLGAHNVGAPRAVRWGAKLLLDALRAIHTLVFGLIFVGVVGLEPTAGILAIATHSMGTYGKLYTEAIEAIDMTAADAVKAVGASRAQVFFIAIWPAGSQPHLQPIDPTSIIDAWQRTCGGSMAGSSPPGRCSPRPVISFRNGCRSSCCAGPMAAAST